MSTSRDNLPAVARTGEHPAVPELEPIAEATRKTLGDVRWLLAISLGGIAAIVVATSATIAFAQDAGVKSAAPVAADLRDFKQTTSTRIDALDRKFDNAEERNAKRFEVLYNAILERRPQPGADALMRTDAGP